MNENALLYGSQQRLHPCHERIYPAQRFGRQDIERPDLPQIISKVPGDIRRPIGP